MDIGFVDIYNKIVLLTSDPEHSLSISNITIILLKSQLLQFSMYLLYNFSFKTYYLKCLKSARKTLVNISL